MQSVNGLVLGLVLLEPVVELTQNPDAKIGFHLPKLPPAGTLSVSDDDRDELEEGAVQFAAS